MPHTRFSDPLSVQEGDSMVSQPPKLWPFGSISVTSVTASQREQWWDLLPGSVQVAGSSIVQSLSQSWSRAGTVSVSSAWQTEQTRYFSPVSVQVAAVFVTHSPQEWPVAGIGSVYVWFGSWEQVKVFIPSSVQVAGFVMDST